MIFEVATDAETFYYSNKSNAVYTSDNVLVDFSKYSSLVKAKKENAAIPFDFTNKQYPYPKKDKLIRHLKIQLGTKCNYKCMYCAQLEMHNENEHIPKKDDIDRFFSMMKYAGIQLTDFPKIHLWGGEPLVYWKTLLILIPELRKRWPNAELWFVSNGTLMSIDKLQFLIDYRVHLTFSHDGQAYFLRGKNPLDDAKMTALWKKVKQDYEKNDLSFKLNAVISQYNSNLYALDNYFTNKLGSSIKYKYEDVVIAHTKNAVCFTEFPKAAQDNLEASVHDAILGGEHNAPNKRIAAALSPWILETARQFIYRVPTLAIRAKCNAIDPDALSVDLSGKVLSCHNVSSDWQMGSLLDYNNIIVNKFKHWSLRKCVDCPYLAACRGGCSRNNDRLHEYSCRAKIVLSRAVFNTVWEMLIGIKIRRLTNAANHRVLY